MQEVFYNNEGAEVWPCKYCAASGTKKEYLCSGGTRNIETHLAKSHNIFESSPMEKRLEAQQLSIQEALDSAELNPSKKRKLTEETPYEKILDGAVLESLYVRWISTDNQALRLVQCPEFRALLTYLNSNINVFLVNSPSSCNAWVYNQYTIEMARIKARIQSARTKVHISLDIWTSPNCLPILAIIAHYISVEGVLEDAVLAMVEIQGTHDGENVAPQVEEVLNQWGILPNLGYFQMDNASNNDTLLRAFAKSKLTTQRSRCLY